ncbi:uncharacterized protein LOC127282147 [Leptopilina boulardi]|uniref:uncharacterized protein LOC127282147 n=1 Tax=Leptopilina boulardi TaxID=63433 RepID=UPI0021F56B60|nr:uncharacterized protein LOC127282147 [Leptopilina boulardi]
MSRKAPKAICYSLSESADFRFSCAVTQKNTRHQYVQNTLQKLELSPGAHLSTLWAKNHGKHIERTKRSHLLRTRIANQPEFKKRRQQLKKLCSQLRKSKELVDEDTYESNVSLLTIPTEKNFDLKVTVDVNAENLPQLSTNYPIPSSASNVNGLTKDGRDLLLHGKKVPSHSLRIVLGEFLKFLIDCDKKCILLAHNCSFDAPRLVKIACDSP